MKAVALDGCLYAERVAHGLHGETSGTLGEARNAEPEGAVEAVE